VLPLSLVPLVVSLSMAASLDFIFLTMVVPRRVGGVRRPRNIGLVPGERSLNL
jgi:hypothetical protein